MVITDHSDDTALLPDADAFIPGDTTLHETPAPVISPAAAPPSATTAPTGFPGQRPTNGEPWWWSMTSVIVAGLVVMCALAIAAMVIDVAQAGVIAGAAFTAVGVTVTAVVGLRTTREQANAAAVFAAHVPEDRAAIAIQRAGIRRFSG